MMCSVLRIQWRRLAVAAVVLLCLAAAPLSASSFTVPFTVTIDGGTYPGFGGVYFGSAMYDDTNLLGFLGESLDPGNGLIDLSLTAPDPTGALVVYDETHDDGYPAGPLIFFTAAGNPYALNWFVSGPPLTPPQIMWTDEFDETFNLSSGGNETVVSGPLVFGDPVRMDEIPEPATVALLGTGLGLLALIRRRRASRP